MIGHLLIVDDDRSMCTLLATDFERRGFEVTWQTQPATVMDTLQRRVMLFFTGKSRNSGDILKKQSSASQKKDPSTLERMHQIKKLGLEMTEALKHCDLDAFGHLLHQSWLQKRGIVSDISNDLIDQAYAAAREQGALGGKIAGNSKQPAFTVVVQDRYLPAFAHVMRIGKTLAHQVNKPGVSQYKKTLVAVAGK